MPETPAERRIHARAAALSRVAQEPSGARMTENARNAFRQRFYDNTDPSLPEQERRRQAEAARRLFYVDLARKASAARRRMLQAADGLTALGERLADPEPAGPADATG